jgi:hypothetical protein
MTPDFARRVEVSLRLDGRARTNAARSRCTARLDHAKIATTVGYLHT